LSLEQRIAAAVDERAEDLVALASELIRFDTTVRGTPDEPPRDEAALQETLAARLEAVGAEVELSEPEPGSLDRWQRQVPAGLGFAGRPQLVARLPGSAGGRSLFLCGHVDAVTAEPRERWASDPFEPEVRDGLLYGRGACDMKGGVATIVGAVEALAEAGVELAGELVIATVTDEEWNGAGALAIASQGVGADAGIVPEATGFEPWVACRGVLNPTITVAGRPGHAETPQPDWREGGAVNAIEKAIVVLDAVRELRERWRDETERHPLLAPGELIPTVIGGGEWWVSYPASCTTSVDVTYLPGQADSDGGWGSAVEREIEEWVLSRARGDAWLAENPPEFSWGTNLPPAEIDPKHPIVDCVLGAGDAVQRPGKVGALQGWHDAATFTHFGTPTISYGPSGFSNDGRTVAHTIDEFVPVDDLVACAKALAVATARWCGTTDRTQAGSR
jgi:acetylornithine deacetylase